MADQADVERALVGRVEAALYPDGVGGPSVVGVVCRTYRGWPAAAALDAELRVGRVHVTVFPGGEPAEDTTRWSEEELPLAPVAPVLGVAVAGETAVFFGSAAPGQVAGVLVGGAGYAYRTGPGDTPEMVAAVLGERVREAGRAVVVDGASVRVPGAGLVVARVVADQNVARELRRERQGFRVACWCPGAELRDRVAGVVDAGLAGVGFLALGDGTAARVLMRAGEVFDRSQNARLWRRDLVASVEYAVGSVVALPSMLFGVATVGANGAGEVARRVS